MTVWRVTPTRSARSAWVISPWLKRSARIELVTRVGLTMSEAPPVRHDLRHRGAERGQAEREVERVGDPEVVDLGHGQHQRHQRGEAHDVEADELADAVDLPVALVFPVHILPAGEHAGDDVRHDV